MNSVAAAVPPMSAPDSIYSRRSPQPVRYTETIAAYRSEHPKESPARHLPQLAGNIDDAIIICLLRARAQRERTHRLQPRRERCMLGLHVRDYMWGRLRSSPLQAIVVDAPSSHPSRSTRFYLDIPVSFAVDGCRHDGLCLNVSASGLLATFDQPPELWLDGKLSFETGEHYLCIDARVARRQDRDIGFAFYIITENDLASIRILTNFVADRPMAE